MMKKLHYLPLWKQHLFSVLFSLFCMGMATGISLLYYHNVPNNSANLALVYILALMLVARFCRGYWYGIICSFISVCCINYMFTYPYFQLNFTLTGYPVTFIGMLAITLFVSTMTSHLARQSEILAEREKQLVEAEREKMRANLLRAISHDLRTPLTGMIGNSSVYLENKERLSEEEKTEIITNIYNDSNWLLNMVENLLSITRITGDNFSINTSEEPVEEVVSEALEKLRKRYPDAQILVQIPNDFILLPMDAILIEQVTINLLENAILHSESKKPISFIVEDHPDKVSFIVRDYGVGISDVMLSSLFEGGSYAPSHSPDSHKGMGIGLSICKTIITAHRGTLIGRNHAQGAEFLFTLPKNISDYQGGRRTV